MPKDTPAIPPMPADSDPFHGHEPLKELPHLGRHIRDRHGAVSGSSANFERTRGAVDEPPPPDAATLAAHHAKVVKEFGGVLSIAPPPPPRKLSSN